MFVGDIFSPTNGKPIWVERKEDVFEDMVKLAIVQLGHQVKVFLHL